MGFGWVDMGLEEGLVEDDPPYLMFNGPNLRIFKRLP